MTEETQVQEEIQAQEEAQAQQQVESQSLPTPKEEKQDKNWERANEVLKLQKQRIEELEAKLVQQPPKQVAQEEPDEFANLDPDDYLTVDKARKLAEKLAEKKAYETSKKVVQEYMQQQNVSQDELRMRTKHEDYDYVVENYAIPLIKNDPALAYQIRNSKSPAETAYKLGKLSDAYEESNMKQQNSPKADKILKNSSRPVSSNAVGSPLKSQADQFSKMSQSEIWNLSQKYSRGA